MERLIVLLCLMFCFAAGKNVPDMKLSPAVNEQHILTNSSDPNKDMYVIHAMVYQVGIITNKTDQTNGTDLLGNQEAVTFYHTNGSNIDLSKMPAPLLTNVTAQRMVGIAPVDNGGSNTRLPWDEFGNLVSKQQNDNGNLADTEEDRHERAADYEGSSSEDDGFYPFLEREFKRSLNVNPSEVASGEKTPVKIVNGAAVVPQDAGISSIAIPPLLTLNNNFSEIPVPIPNTSVIHYAKVNTLVHSTSP